MPPSQTQPKAMRVLSSIEVQYPKKKTKCDFHLKCKGQPLSPREQAIQVVSINGAGPQVEWGCVPCGRVVMLTHAARLARMQGYILDTLNQANAIHYLRDGITTAHAGQAPKHVAVSHPTQAELQGEAEMEKKATEEATTPKPLPKPKRYTKASARDESE